MPDTPADELKQQLDEQNADYILKHAQTESTLPHGEKDTPMGQLPGLICEVCGQDIGPDDEWYQTSGTDAHDATGVHERCRTDMNA